MAFCSSNLNVLRHLSSHLEKDQSENCSPYQPEEHIIYPFPILSNFFDSLQWGSLPLFDTRSYLSVSIAVSKKLYSLFPGVFQHASPSPALNKYYSKECIYFPIHKSDHAESPGGGWLLEGVTTTRSSHSTLHVHAFRWDNRIFP